MNIYRVSHAANGYEPTYYGTLKDAHVEMKKIATVNCKPWVDLIDFPTDKVGLLAVLNHNLVAAGVSAIRSWDLTNRGGLVETVQGDGKGEEPTL